MIRRILTVVVVLLVPAIAGAQANRDAIAKQLEANERAINVAIQKGDVAAFKALVADDAVAVDGNGVMAVSEFVKEFAQIKLASFTIEQVKVTFATDNAAVITYRFTAKGSMMGQPMPSPVLASTTYANRGGKWVAVFHQETIPTPPPPATKK
jgi:ketosteroid isomerase-like protein